MEEVQELVNSFQEDVKIINLSKKDLTELPDLSRFTKLKQLNCAYNKLTSLPLLPNSLQILNCNDNQLTSLPDPLPNFLNTLDCYNNKLTSLPSNICSLPLHYLLIKQNKFPINSLPNCIRKYSNLSIDNLNLIAQDLSEPINEKSPLSVGEPIQLSITEEGYDPIIRENLSIKTYLEEDPSNNLVFKIHNDYIFSTKETIHSQKSTAIFYECYRADNRSSGLLPGNINKEQPLYNLRSIGFTVNYVLIGQVNTILSNSDSDDSNQNIYVIKPTNNPEKQLASVVSQQFFTTTQGAGVSQSHCQEGQGDVLYQIVKSPIQWEGVGGKRRKYGKITKRTRTKRTKRKRRKYRKITKRKRRKYKKITKRKITRKQNI